MRHDDEDEVKPAPDSDRTAILARRKQFIALALSGLTTTAACDKEAPSKGGKSSSGEQADTSKPQPCLTVSPEPPQPETPPEPKPQPCLKMPPPEEPPQPETPPEPLPQPCLSMPIDPEPKPEPQPRPCLKKAMPD
jgi:hypothetical protein